jgi:tetratricopeptide (TPR) repeat protein
VEFVGSYGGFYPAYPDAALFGADLNLRLRPAARAGDLRGALALVDAVLARDPDRYVARLDAARWRAILGDLDGATRDFTVAHALSPDAAAPLAGLSRVAAMRGDRKTALRWLAAAEKADGGDAEVRALKKELER